MRILEFNFSTVTLAIVWDFASINGRPLLCWALGHTATSAGINQLSPIKGL